MGRQVIPLRRSEDVEDAIAAVKNKTASAKISIALLKRRLFLNLMRLVVVGGAIESF